MTSIGYSNNRSVDMGPDACGVERGVIAMAARRVESQRASLQELNNATTSVIERLFGGAKTSDGSSAVPKDPSQSCDMSDLENEIDKLVREVLRAHDNLDALRRL